MQRGWSVHVVRRDRGVRRRLRDGVHVERLEVGKWSRLRSGADYDTLADAHLEDALPWLGRVHEDLDALALQCVLDTTRDLGRARLERVSGLAVFDHDGRKRAAHAIEKAKCCCGRGSAGGCNSAAWRIWRCRSKESRN